jgi:putative ABC transport system substrate-binding protein
MSVRSRRRFLQGTLALAGLGLVSGCGVPLPWSSPARARRIGYFAEEGSDNPGTGALGGLGQPAYFAFRDGLRDLGYVEGENLELARRVAEVGQEGAYPELATELAGSRPDLLVASGTAPAAALARAAMKLDGGGVPVVFIAVGAPVEIGLVQSLAHPGGHVTGLSSFSPELAGKRLELLKEAAPAVARPAVLWNPADADDAVELAAMQPAAALLGLALRPTEVRTPEGVFAALQAAMRDGADAIVQIADHISYSVVATTAVRARLPTVGDRSRLATNGGLLALGASYPAMHRRAATYADRILRGTRPAELPVEQPTTFDLVVNLQTARTLGLTIPQAVLAQATEVVQ